MTENEETALPEDESAANAPGDATEEADAPKKNGEESAPESVGEAEKAPQEPAGPVPIALIVEDSKIIRRMLVMQIKSLGFEVLEAEHGQQGLDRLAAMEMDRCKVIFLDVMMPEMDGAGFLRAAQKTYGKALPPVIVCTTKGDVKTVKTFGALGAKGYILKPFKTPVLQEKLRHLGVLP